MKNDEGDRDPRQRHYDNASRSGPPRPDYETGAEDRSDPYYSRARPDTPPRSNGYAGGRLSGAWRGDQERTTTALQRARGFEPRGDIERGRDIEQGRDDEPTYYRGYYNRSVTPYANPGEQVHLYAESWTIAGPYTGRGPKGYQRSDQQIVDEASQRLERAGHIDATDIEVTAQDGVITLCGTVADRATKRRAEECVESVYGARDVMNILRVTAPLALTERASPESPQAQAPRREDDGPGPRKGGSGKGPH